MGKYPIRLIGTPVVPGDLDYDMDPPEWHTPWFEADALDADGHHHRVYWPIPDKPRKFPSTFRPFRSAPHPCGAERSTRPGASSEAPGFLFFYGCGKYPAARIASVEIATLASITSSHPASPCAATASRASVGQ